MFVTPGVLLRKFQSDPGLGEFTHIIIDEIHERDKHTEFLMIALRELLDRRSDLNIILMSATIQTNELMEYWSSAGLPSEINVPGRTFPVQEFFLEDALHMTGFVNDSSKYFVDPMDDIEASLARLLNNGSQAKQDIEPDLICIMCGKKGFKSPEELGTHVALCDGAGSGGIIDALALEERVRSARMTVTSMRPNIEPFDDEEVISLEEEVMKVYDDADDEDIFGLREGKWDGESPFAVSDNLALGSATTLTEEEMLNRYQTVHDDQQIDNELILEVIKFICKSSYGDGAILIFLPGWQEISELILILESTSPFADKSKFLLLPLHSGIPSKEQRFVFQKPRQGVRKIVLATNIAETSITIDDVAFVVDTGRAKEKVSNQSWYHKFQSIFIHYEF